MQGCSMCRGTQLEQLENKLRTQKVVITWEFCMWGVFVSHEL